jgi:hypothetical protein
MTTPKKHTDRTDMNRDPITGAPGSHPIGTGVGALGGGAAGAAAGAIFGPIGMLVGGTIGTIAGAAAGKGAAEQIDPTGEVDYWRSAHATRPYANRDSSYDIDYAPAYRYGVESRNAYPGRFWDTTLEADLERDWSGKRAGSTLDWTRAKPAVRDAWDRTDRSYSAYNATDRFYQARFDQADYRDTAFSFDDYRNAYRYGTYARTTYPNRSWDPTLESDLEKGWDHFKGASKLTWAKAKAATRDAWHSFERVLPGDADNDGR